MRGMVDFAEGLWREDTCDEFVEAALKLPAEKGTIADNLVSDTRRCTVRWLHPSPQWRALFDEVTLLFQQTNQNNFGLDISFVPEIQFTEYDESNNGKFDWHEDINWLDPRPTHRKLSMSVQLSSGDEYEGGDLTFREDIQTPPADTMRSKGSVIVFPSFVGHCVTPVTKGKRYSLVAWMEGPQFR